MARQGLRIHPKFKRLMAALHMPEAHVLGHLTMLWESSYELGEDLGDSIDVEITSGWVGSSGVLCDALLNCGGSERSGFIEMNPSRPGIYRVHDLFDHAPAYVQKRMEREGMRISKGQSISDLRRSAANKMHERKKAMQMDATENHLHDFAEIQVQMDASERTPSPSPSPSPLKEIGAGAPIVVTTTTVQEAITQEKPKRKRRTQEEIRFGYSVEVRKVVNCVLAPGFWRKADPDGRVIAPDTSILCDNVQTILENHQNVTPELLIEAARNYLAKDKQAYSAPQYFYGPGKNGETPKWVAEVKFAAHQEQRKAEMEAEQMQAAS